MAKKTETPGTNEPRLRSVDEQLTCLVVLNKMIGSNVTALVGIVSNIALMLAKDKDDMGRLVGIMKQVADVKKTMDKALEDSEAEVKLIRAQK